MMERIADNATKIKQNKVLPYLVSKVVEVSLYQTIGGGG
jgi:26S proteasome regulatory subunit T5